MEVTFICKLRSNKALLKEAMVSVSSQFGVAVVSMCDFFPLFSFVFCLLIDLYMSFWLVIFQFPGTVGAFDLPTHHITSHFTACLDALHPE